MKPTITFALFFALGTLWLSSCVSKGKYLTSQSRIQKLQSDSSATHGALSDCYAKVKGLEGERTNLLHQAAVIENDLQNAQNSSTRSKLTIEEQAKRLKALQDLIQSQRDVMDKLKKSIADALVNFKPDELTVSIQDGKVYVSLQEKLLFKSGSAVVDPKGKQALGTLASVLNTTPDITVMIEGHTDTVPIKKLLFEDNWALSVARATSIVRILTKEYGADPYRITAAGRGEFHPVRTNETDEGKASNRRTEIILSPNLNQLYQLLSQ